MSGYRLGQGNRNYKRWEISADTDTLSPIKTIELVRAEIFDAILCNIDAKQYGTDPVGVFCYRNGDVRIEVVSRNVEYGGRVVIIPPETFVDLTRCANPVEFRRMAIVALYRDGRISSENDDNLSDTDERRVQERIADMVDAWESNAVLLEQVTVRVPSDAGYLPVPADVHWYLHHSRPQQNVWCDEWRVSNSRLEKR